jgi:hypothetical protein
MAFLSGGDTQRMRVVLALLVLALAGCGVSHELPKQADEVASVAAEGSLLAHDAAEGDTTDTFTREHAKALRKRLRELEPAIASPELGRLAAKVDEVLGVLADRPGDRDLAGTFERVLESHAHAAEEVAG